MHFKPYSLPCMCEKVSLNWTTSFVNLFIQKENICQKQYQEEKKTVKIENESSNSSFAWYVSQSSIYSV